MFAGFVQLDGTLNGVALVRTSALVPINADALPTFRVYGPGGFIESGTCTFLDSASISAATNASPIVCTSNEHGLSTGDLVTVAGATGNTGANGTYNITVNTINTFDLVTSVGNGAYAADTATWNITGAYRYSITVLAADKYEAGENYFILFTFEESSADNSLLHSFVVN